MNEWFTDPKSLAVILGAAFSVAISVWQGRQTAEAVADLVRWRESVAGILARLETRIGHCEVEITRLRNSKEMQ